MIVLAVDTMEMDLEGRLLSVLQAKGGEGGLTHAELRQACGAGWRRDLAKHSGVGEGEAGAAEMRSFVHVLWMAGKVMIEPPSGKGQAVRIWHPEVAGDRFNQVKALQPGGVPEEEAIADAYERLVQKTRSPYVFLSLLAEEAGLVLEDLHQFLEKAREAGRAVLSTGDWSAATEPEKEAALMAGGRRYIKVRLISDEGDA